MSAALPSEKVAEVRRLRYEERLSQREAAKATGLSRETVQKYAPGGKDGTPPRNIDNTPLREAFLASGRPAQEVARAIGWTCVSRKDGWVGVRGDNSRLSRALGLQPEHSRGRRFRRQTINPANALLIGTELGLDPHEIGL